MTIIGDIFTLKERAKMQAYFSGVWGLSSVLGPVVGGFITDQFSWHWVFFINLPVGLAAALIMGAALKEPKYTVRPAVDYAGAGLLMASITLIMLALVEGGTTFTTFFAAHNLIFIVSAIVLLALFAVAERRAADPIIPFHLFKNRTVFGFGRRGISGGRLDVRRDFLCAAFRAGRAGFDGDRSRFAADAADGQLGYYVGRRRASDVKTELSLD
jgi:MFS family permease